MPLLYPVSELDANQVLKYVFDEANQRLRVAAEIVAPLNMGDVEVSIVHTEDSVRLGDGVNFITSTTLGGSVALDVNVISTGSTATTPIIANVSMATAGTEYLYSFASDTKKVMIKSRKGNIKFSYTVGTTGTNYVSLPSGANYFVEDINFNGITIYFQSDKSADVLEVHSFT